MTQARKLIVMVLEIKPSTNVMTTASTADLEIAFRSACLDEGFELVSCAVKEDESDAILSFRPASIRSGHSIGPLLLR